MLTSLGLCAAFGQTYTISTFAGSTPQVNIPGKSATLGGGVYRVTVDQAGNLFFSDQGSVLRLDATTGVLTLTAGNGTDGFSGDNGAATAAQLFLPHGVTVDKVGNVYVADWNNAVVRKISNGVITTVAGGGSSLGDNGPATSAQLISPKGLALDSLGNLYIADEYSGRVRKVTNGVITTVAGSGVPSNGAFGFSGDNGPATSAQLNGPYDVAADLAGNLYITDSNNNRIRKVSNGLITTIAGNGTVGFSGDNGPAISAQFNRLEGIAVDSLGNLYVADAANNRIRKISNGVITTVAGNGTAGFSGDNGKAPAAELNFPNGIAVDSTGNLYIADTANSSVRRVSNGVITTVAGNGVFGGDNGLATSSQLLLAEQIAVDSSGSAYIADVYDYRIRKISSGVATTVAGNGTYGASSGDNGQATNARINIVCGIAVNTSGDLYVSSCSGECLVRRVSNGVITTVAGTGTCGVSGDGGPAAVAELDYPNGLAVDTAGNLYIAEYNRVRKVSTSGVITTLAGGGSSLGDNGPAISAQFQSIAALAVDSGGNLYVADVGGQRIRKVSNGVITTVAGNGTQGFNGDNIPATSAELNDPFGVAVDTAGNVYIGDQDNNRVRKISNGLITTISGNGMPGLSGDNGLAISAQLSSPNGVAADSAGNIYVADVANNRIRLLTSCTYTLNQTSLQPSPLGVASLSPSRPPRLVRGRCPDYPAGSRFQAPVRETDQLP